MLPPLHSERNWMIAIAYGLALAWAVSWLWFGVASGISEGDTPFAVFLHAMAPGFFCLALALTAFYSEWTGGILLVVTGLVFALMYPIVFTNSLPSVKLLCEITLAVPPLVAGILLIKHFRISSGGRPRMSH